MGTHRAQQSVEIAADPKACFDAVCDFESYPEWQSAVRSCRVVERDGSGQVVVETVLDARVRDVRYVLRYGFDPPGRIWWDYVEGDARSIEGDYEFADLGERRTRATYRVEVDPGRFVPAPLRRLIAGPVMRRSVEELRQRVERAG